MFSVRNAEATPGGRPVALRFADDARGCCVHAWEEHLTNSPGWLHSVLVFAAIQRSVRQFDSQRVIHGERPPLKEAA
jgi:hypothetical protein